jgi:hypothetical protein
MGQSLQRPIVLAGVCLHHYARAVLQNPAFYHPAAVKLRGRRYQLCAAASTEMGHKLDPQVCREHCFAVRSRALYEWLGKGMHLFLTLF